MPLPPPPPKFKPKPAPSAAVPVASASLPPLRFQINNTPQGFHWVLMLGNHVVTGHYGPNPKTRAGAIEAIEKFKATVMNATIKPENE